jgi:hypothetical protein
LLTVLSLAAVGSAETRTDDRGGQRPAKAEAPADDLSTGILVGTSEAEIRIEKVLDELTELEFIEAPLTDVIHFLKGKHHIEIQIDNRALEESGVAPDTPITRNLKGISLRSALRLVLRDMKLSYVIVDEVLLITTIEHAKTILQTKIYRVDDLIDDGNFEEIISVITGSVAPTNWAETGGTGSIRQFTSAPSLVIRQTEEAQQEIRHLLVALRKARNLELAKPQGETKSD